jgi:alpha-glucosidase
MMVALLLALKGTTLIYQGEELGLPQAKLARDQLRDPVGDLYWPYSGGRDGCRTPMPWSSGETLGFTTGTPWLPAAKEHRGLTVEAQAADPDSTLAFARRMIAFRKGSAAMTSGDLSFLETEDPVLVFVRAAADGRIACLFNMSGRPQSVELDALSGGEIMPVSSEAEIRGRSLELSPHGAVFVRLA